MLKGVVIDDAAEWEAFYNYHRPHGALGGQTPYERLKQKPQERPPSKRSTSAAYPARSGTCLPGRTEGNRAFASCREPWGPIAAVLPGLGRSHRSARSRR
jgi:hypothetical protein